MTEEQQTFFRLASLVELLHYQRLGGSVPAEAFARARAEALAKGRPTDEAYLAGLSHPRRPNHTRPDGADAA